MKQSGNRLGFKVLPTFHARHAAEGRDPSPRSECPLVSPIDGPICADRWAKHAKNPHIFTAERAVGGLAKNFTVRLRSWWFSYSSFEVDRLRWKSSDVPGWIGTFFVKSPTLSIEKTWHITCISSGLGLKLGPSGDLPILTIVEMMHQSISRSPRPCGVFSSSVCWSNKFDIA